MGEYGEAMYQKAIEMGKHEKSVEMSISLIRMQKLTLEEIALATRLPLEEVKELAASIEMNDTDDTNGTNSTTE